MPYAMGLLWKERSPISHPPYTFLFPPLSLHHNNNNFSFSVFCPFPLHLSCLPPCLKQDIIFPIPNRIYDLTIQNEHQYLWIQPFYMHYAMHPLIVMGGGGGGRSHHATLKYPCLHNNNAALIKQISLFDTALVMTFQFKKLKSK